MQERLDLIKLMLELTEDELALVISRAERELGLRWHEDPELPHQSKT